MDSNLFQHLAEPAPFHAGEVNFWDDEHISEQMLNAVIEGRVGNSASGTKEDVECAAAWIADIYPPVEHPRLLDLGCGPGLCAEQFHAKGYHVTGIDFSKHAIEWARARATTQMRQIVYLYQNFLDLDYSEMFDLVTFLFCNYGTLSPEHAAKTLANIHTCLKPGGKLVMNVFSINALSAFTEAVAWDFHEAGGFWSPEAHHCLRKKKKIDDQITLEHIVVIEPERSQSYSRWNRYFTKKGFADEIGKAGFRNIHFFDDVSGASYTGSSNTLTVVLEK